MTIGRGILKRGNLKLLNYSEIYDVVLSGILFYAITYAEVPEEDLLMDFAVRNRR